MPQPAVANVCAAIGKTLDRRQCDGDTKTRQSNDQGCQYRVSAAGIFRSRGLLHTRVSYSFSKKQAGPQQREARPMCSRFSVRDGSEAECELILTSFLPKKFCKGPRTLFRRARNDALFPVGGECGLKDGPGPALSQQVALGSPCGTSWRILQDGR